MARSSSAKRVATDKEQPLEVDAAEQRMLEEAMASAHRGDVVSVAMVEKRLRAVRRRTKRTQ